MCCVCVFGLKFEMLYKLHTPAHTSIILGSFSVTLGLCSGMCLHQWGVLGVRENCWEEIEMY